MAGNEWKPPKKLLPIDDKAYAGLRQYIDAGVAATAAYDKRIAEGCTQDCSLKGKPGISEIAETLYQYIPATSLPLPDGYDDSDRTSVVTFRLGRDVLLQALNDATPINVLQKFNNADPENKGIDWWAVALSALGVLAILGGARWKGAILAKIAAGLLGWLVAEKAIEKLSPAAQDILNKFKKAAEQTIGAIPYVLVGGAVLAIVVAVVSHQKKSEKELPKGAPA